MLLKKVRLTETNEKLKENIKMENLKNYVKSASETLNAQKTKCSRKLYVGNLPTDMVLTENMLVQFFTSCLQGLGLKTPMPIINSWINSDQTFAFIEFRGVQDATLALSLCDGLTLGGRSLRFGRAVDFKSPPKHLRCYMLGDDESVETNETIFCYKMPNVTKGTPAWNLAKSLEAQYFKDVSATEDVQKIKPRKTKVLLFENCVTEEMIEKDEDYIDVIEDIQEECINWGHLLQIVVPRRGADKSGFNRVFVRYKTQLGADKCFLKTNGREFGEQIIKVSYYDETKFIEGIWDSKSISVEDELKT